MMDIFRANKSMILTLLGVLLLIVLITYLTLGTSLFNSDKRMINEVNKAETGQVKEKDYNISMPSELEDYAKDEAKVNYDNLSKEQKIVADSWTQLKLEKSDKSIDRDMKMEAKGNIYKSLELASKKYDKSVEDILKTNNVLYGDVGFGFYQVPSGQETGLYYSNEIKSIKDIRIEGVAFNNSFTGVILDIRNDSDKLLSRKELLATIKVSVNDVTNANSIKNINKLKVTPIEDDLGVRMVKTLTFPLNERLYDYDNNINSQGYEDLPENLKVSIEYEGEKIDYTLDKGITNVLTSFNIDQEMKLRNQ